MHPIEHCIAGTLRINAFDINTEASLDAHPLLVANDNNYPGTGGRNLGSDNTEFLKIRLDQALNVSPVPEQASVAMLLGGLGVLGLKLRWRAQR